jgi:hypothetical protein
MTNSSTRSVRSLPHWWRITRYDPARRDERGAYPVAAWTSIADVGTVFDEVELTLAEYERVEAAYVEAFSAFAEESGIDELVVRSLESGDGMEEGEVLSLENARAVVRRMLREEVICKLEAPNATFVVHVGFDLYMYVGSMRSCPSGERRVRSLRLFVEPGWPSPLWPEDDE